MKLSLLFLLPLSLFAKLDLDFSGGTQKYHYLKVSSSFQLDSTDVVIKDKRFDVKEDLTYDNRYTQMQLSGSFGTLKYEVNYEESLDEDTIKETTFFIGNPDLRMLWLGGGERKNAFSTTTESNGGFYAVFDVRNKKYEMQRDGKRLSFDAQMSRLSTEHVFYALAKKRAYNYDDFNFFGLAFGYSKNRLKAYGTIYYAFSSIRIENLHYQTATSDVLQYKKEEIRGNGFTTGYKANIEYKTEKLSASLFLKVEQAGYDITNNIKRDRMMMEYKKFDLNVYGSLLYKF